MKLFLMPGRYSKVRIPCIESSLKTLFAKIVCPQVCLNPCMSGPWPLYVILIWHYCAIRLGLMLCEAFICAIEEILLRAISRWYALENHPACLYFDLLPYCSEHRDIERAIARLCASSLGSFGRDGAAVVLYEDAAKRKVNAFVSVLKGLTAIKVSLNFASSNPFPKTCSSQRLLQTLMPRISSKCMLAYIHAWNALGSCILGIKSWKIG